MNELGLLFIFGFILVFFIVLNDIKKKKYKNLRDYLIVGTLIAILDIIIESIGTFNNFWTYNESIYFLFDKVPIELPLMFFMAGVLGKWIHGISKRIKFNLQLNILFFSLTLFGVIMYLRSTILLGINEEVAIFAIPAALWGFHTIKNEIDKASVLIVALFVAILDYVLEVIIVGTGSYTYLTGFKLSIPLNYFLLTIAFFGLMEKLKVLDNILEYPIIREVIWTAGIKRQEYMLRLKRRIQR